MANEDKRIIELPASESILNDDWIGKDSASQGTTRLQLSFLKQLCGGNNFAGEWQSGTTYSKDSYVTREGKLYHNITGSATSTTWKASQWQEINVSDEIKKLAGDLATTFSTATSYAVGDYVVYNNTLYKCTTAHSAGAWNSSRFTSISVADMIEEIMSQFNATIEQIYSNIAPTFSTSTSYAVGDYVIYEDQLYECTTAHSAGVWNNADFTSTDITTEIKDAKEDLSNETIHIDDDGMFYVYVDSEE